MEDDQIALAIVDPSKVSDAAASSQTRPEDLLETSSRLVI